MVIIKTIIHKNFSLLIYCFNTIQYLSVMYGIIFMYTSITLNMNIVCLKTVVRIVLLFTFVL